MALNAASSSASSFNPTDEDLILRFLSNKVNRKPLPNDATNNIHECDLYGEKNPWEVWEDFGGVNGRELYFFTTKKREGSRLVRTIGMGSWEAETTKGKAINAKGTNNPRRIGTKTCLRFEKSGTNHDGAWIMHEYSLHRSLVPSNILENNYVVCKLIKNEGGHIRPQKTGIKERTGQEVNTRSRTRQSTQLQIAAHASPTDNNGGLGHIQERPIRSEIGQLQAKTKVDETAAMTTQPDYEEHDERTINEEPPMEDEEEIQLLSNETGRLLLLERFEGLTLSDNVASNLMSSPENAATNNSMSTSTTAFIGRKYECSICHRVFPNGQVLDEHMRSHNSSGMPSAEGGTSGHRHHDFDLNLPPARRS